MAVEICFRGRGAVGGLDPFFSCPKELPGKGHQNFRLNTTS